MKTLFHIGADGKVQVNQPFILECGCASASSAINRIMRMTKIPQSFFPRVKLSGNKLAKRYLQDNGYYDKYSQIKKGNYAMLVNPADRTAIDLYEKNKTKLSKEVTHVFKGV